MVHVNNGSINIDGPMFSYYLLVLNNLVKSENFVTCPITIVNSLIGIIFGLDNILTWWNIF